MLKQLRPASDLQRQIGFDDYDLTANRNGMLSSRQRWRFVGARLADHLFGALTVSFIAALMVNMFHYSPPLNVVIIAAVVILSVTFILFAFHVRQAFLKSVKGLKGKIVRHDTMPINGLPVDEISIGTARFFVPFNISDALDEGAIYQAYYLERKVLIGGNKLLSVEFLEPAPEEDEEEEYEEVRS